MGEVVNLKRARKARARLADEAEAAGRRARFGRTKAEKAEGKSRRTALGRHLDGHRVEP